MNITKTCNSMAVYGDDFEDVFALNLFDVHVCDAFGEHSDTSIIGHRKDLVYRKIKEERTTAFKDGNVVVG